MAGYYPQSTRACTIPSLGNVGVLQLVTTALSPWSTQDGRRRADSMSEKLWNAILCLQSSESSDVLNKFTCTVSECSWLEDYSQTGSSTRTKTNLMERGGFILLASGRRRKTCCSG